MQSSVFVSTRLFLFKKEADSDIDIWAYFNIFTPQKNKFWWTTLLIYLETPCFFCGSKLRESPGCDFNDVLYKARKLGEKLPAFSQAGKANLRKTRLGMTSLFGPFG